MPGRNAAINMALLATSVLVMLVLAEAALWVLGIPEPLISGWRTPERYQPINQLGWRGRSINIAPDDFVVVLVGDSHVECRACPAEETTDLMLERALRGFNPKVRVVSLGSAGFGNDQELLALEEYFRDYRADLVVNWFTLDNDIWNNTFRAHSVTSRRAPPKPSFWLEDGVLRGPTELPGTRTDTPRALRLVGLVERVLNNPETEWGRRLPPATPGAGAPPEGVSRAQKTSELLETQLSHWSIKIRPRPPRVDYGIALTRALLERMRALAAAHGARFVMFRHGARLTTPLVGDAPPSGQVEGGELVAVGHNGHWFLADDAMQAAAEADVTRGFEFFPIRVTVADYRVSEKDGHLNLAANRQVLGDLAKALARAGWLAKR